MYEAIVQLYHPKWKTIKSFINRANNNIIPQQKINSPEK